MNSVELIGNLTREPELTYTANTNTAICKFTIAINRPRRNGEDHGADYPRIVVWGRQAETCNMYLYKGSKVAIVGRIQTGSYKDRDGKTVYTTDIVAEHVEFLSRQERADRKEEDRSFTSADESFSFSADGKEYSFSAVDDAVPF